MQAIILSAGKGTRLYPLTKDVPKVMMRIGGKPLLEHHLDLLKKNKIEDIFINLYTHPEVITNYFGDGKKFGVRIIYATEKKLLGSAGSLQNFRNKFKDDFFVLYGDVYMQVNLLEILKFHRQKKSLFTIVVHESKHPKDSDLVDVDKEKRITNWIRPPHSRLKGKNSAGLYILNREVLRYLPRTIPLDFAHDFIPILLRKIPIYTYLTTEIMMDIGTIDRYHELLYTLAK